MEDVQHFAVRTNHDFDADVGGFALPRKAVQRPVISHVMAPSTLTWTVTAPLELDEALCPRCVLRGGLPPYGRRRDPLRCGQLAQLGNDIIASGAS